ncbi:hypothetical protein [Streptomyces noursei]|uniref:hypothetical protein n=1 Tax=Streptomyces noursei TaxID=1971 RepID=UPI0035586A20
MLGFTDLPLVQLSVDPYAAVLVGCRPEDCPGGGVAPVDSVVAPPGRRERESVDDVPVAVQLGEHHSGEHIPVPVEEGGPQFFRERLKVGGVFGVDVRVVAELGRDESHRAPALVGDNAGAVVRGLDVAGLHRAVAGAPGVRTGTDAEDGDVGSAGPQPRLKEGADVGRGQCPLVEDEQLVLAALASARVFDGLGVSEHQQAAVREAQFVLSPVPRCAEGGGITVVRQLGEQ